MCDQIAVKHNLLPNFSEHIQEMIEVDKNKTHKV